MSDDPHTQSKSKPVTPSPACAGFVLPAQVAPSPTESLTNDDLSKMVDTSDAWIRERTGISVRHTVRRGRRSRPTFGGPRGHPCLR